MAIELINKSGNINLTTPYKKPEKPYVNTSEITDWSYFFTQGRRAEWDIANTDFSNGVNFAYCFNQSDFTGEIILDTPKATNFSQAFNSSDFNKIKINVAGATNIKAAFYDAVAAEEIEFLSETKHIVDFSNSFRGCRELKRIKGLDLSGVYAAYGITNLFYLCHALEECVVSGTLKILSNNFRLDGSPLLTVESLMSFINAFADNTGGPTRTLYFGEENLAKLTDEQKAIATNKNYILV